MAIVIKAPGSFEARSTIVSAALPSSKSQATVNGALKVAATWVENAGGVNARIMRTHYGSLGAPDLIFEQQVKDPGTLETQIKTVTDNRGFEPWASQVSALLEQSSKRALYEIIAAAPETRASLIVEAS